MDETDVGCMTIIVLIFCILLVAYTIHDTAKQIQNVAIESKVIASELRLLTNVIKSLDNKLASFTPAMPVGSFTLLYEEKQPILSAEFPMTLLSPLASTIATFNSLSPMLSSGHSSALRIIQPDAGKAQK